METGRWETRLKSSRDSLPWQQDYQSMWRCSDAQCKSTFDKRWHTLWCVTWLRAASDSWLAVNRPWMRINLVENDRSTHKLVCSNIKLTGCIFTAVQHFTLVWLLMALSFFILFFSRWSGSGWINYPRSPRTSVYQLSRGILVLSGFIRYCDAPST